MNRISKLLVVCLLLPCCLLAKDKTLVSPDGFTYRVVTEHSLCLQWQPVEGAEAYEVYENNAYYATTDSCGISIKNLLPYNHYTYRVRAVADRERSPLTSPMHIVTNETKAQRADRMRWWREARFGMFVHWGVYAAYEGYGRNYRKEGAPFEWQPVNKEHSKNSYGEWIMEKYEMPLKEYRKKAEEVKLDKFSAEQWVKLAGKAGMKYMIVGAKHHDGFCLWNTKTTDWNVVKATSYGKDMIEELSMAARDNDLRFGVYFSHALDWANGGAGRRWDEDMNVRTFDEYIDEVGIPQVHELLGNYGKMDVFWWDMPIEMTHERAKKYYQAVSEHYPLQKGMVQNDRMGNRIFYKDELFPTEIGGDHNTPEQSIPDVPPTGYADGRDWETCMTLNETWGYKANDHLWKSAGEIIRKLADIVSKGGNFLINIGPKPDGSFPKESVALLRKVGEWMEVNGESIYGTTRNTFEQGVPYGRVTRKITSNGRMTLYLHVFDWPKDGMLAIPADRRIKRAYLLADTQQNDLQTESKQREQLIYVPRHAPDESNSVVVVEME